MKFKLIDEGSLTRYYRLSIGDLLPPRLVLRCKGRITVSQLLQAINCLGPLELFNDVASQGTRAKIEWIMSPQIGGNDFVLTGPPPACHLNIGVSSQASALHIVADWQLRNTAVDKVFPTGVLAGRLATVGRKSARRASLLLDPTLRGEIYKVQGSDISVLI